VTHASRATTVAEVASGIRAASLRGTKNWGLVKTRGGSQRTRPLSARGRKEALARRRRADIPEASRSGDVPNVSQGSRGAIGSCAETRRWANAPQERTSLTGEKRGLLTLEGGFLSDRPQRDCKVGGRLQSSRGAGEVPATVSLPRLEILRLDVGP
jgi:hypothetical protein